MAKIKTNTKSQIQKKTVIQKSVQKVQKKESSIMKRIDHKYIIYSIIGVVVLTFIAFLPSLSDAFTNWDDEAYVVSNNLIRSLSGTNLKRFFAEFYLGNYHPLTILSYAIEYNMFKLNPFPYHLNNIILHLVNTGLVLWFVYKFSNKLPVAIITAVLFGIHPVHVESVTWISERKDVLYTFFFMLALVSYLKYREENNNLKYYILTLVFFILSCLSKGMAVTFSAIVILVDYFRIKKIDIKFFYDKIPLLAISGFFGIVAVIAQRSGGASNFGENILNIFTLSDKFLFANYSHFIYLEKMFLPFNLCAIYPYPSKINNSFPAVFYISPIMNILFLGILIYSVIKKKNVIMFGILFFLISIVMMLQIMSVGAAIAADRYFYVASIGLFYIVGEGFNFLYENKKYKIGGIFLAGIVIITLSSLTFERTKVWKNSETLWTDGIEKVPQIELPYYYRAVYFHNAKQYDKAIEDYGSVLKVNPNNIDAHMNRARLLMDKGKTNEALADLNKIIELKPDNIDAYISRGSILMNHQHYRPALVDYNKAIQLNPKYYSGYMNRAIIYSILNVFDSAIVDFNHAVLLAPNAPELYCNRGNYYDMTGKSDLALADYSKAIELNPNQIDGYINRASELMKLNKLQDAMNDLNKLLTIDQNNSSAYYKRSHIWYAQKNIVNARDDAQKAKSLGYPVEAQYLQLLSK